MSTRTLRRGRARARTRSRRRRGLRTGTKLAIGAVAAVLVLAGIFVANNRGSGGGSSTGESSYSFQVGEPGIGAAAPAIELPSTDGRVFGLASERGETVLLYFQEGLMCQPCWDQLRDIERDWERFRALGVDQMATITTDPLDLLQQKVAEESLTSPVLSDPDLAVSEAYTTNRYGMMGLSRNGHSFIVVGPDGRIRWRADYGGAPKHFMYVPIPRLVSDMRDGLNPTD